MSPLPSPLLPWETHHRHSARPSLLASALARTLSLFSVFPSSTGAMLTPAEDHSLAKVLPRGSTTPSGLSHISVTILNKGCGPTVSAQRALSSVAAILAAAPLRPPTLQAPQAASQALSFQAGSCPQQAKLKPDCGPMACGNGREGTVKAPARAGGAKSHFKQALKQPRTPVCTLPARANCKSHKSGPKTLSTLLSLDLLPSKVEVALPLRCVRATQADPSP